uniref:NADH dehydrogenase subunit 2 n=1 Tax=Diacronema viridis TaxID=2793420 RepID=A0A7T1W6J9_9EUKA|nr:NADH dehydrogenase subunit 2 [Diacronema viridis]QPO84603.1 NADH dehydrogenase subunit 2 [Diacronema viridis]QPO84623.1 NADH dehydrogenase subunit 2 [Diacronema viridis]
MNLQNLDLGLLEYDIINAFCLEIFLGWSTLFLLVWVLIIQNRKDLGYLSLSSNAQWITVLIILLSLFICYFSNFTNFTWLPINAVLILDALSFNARVITLVSCLLFFLIASSFMKDHPTSVNELCCLILLSVISFIILISVNDFLSLFLCIELQGLSFYVLACFRKSSDFSIEAGVKYFITGAIASCMMLFGISLIYGITGTLSFEELKQLMLCLSANQLSGITLDNSTTYVGLHLGILFLMAALLFKLGVAPLHFWLPDVYEGSPTNITAFFALVPKVALLVVIVRLLFDVFEPLQILWQPILLQVSIFSVIIGTVGAIYQRRIKRLLAYSTIGHNGFLVLALASVNQEGLNALIVYITLYILTSACIFLFVLNVRERGTLIENPTFYEACGIIKTNPLLGVCLALPLFSLAGIPPLVGFIAKYQMFLAAIQAEYILTSVILVVVSVIACYYYIRFTKVHFFEGSQLIWNRTITRETSVCFSISCGLIFLLSLLPRFFSVFVF